MPLDRFPNTEVSPASRAFTIEPSDTQPTCVVTKALYVGTGGDVALRAYDSECVVVFRNLPDAAILDIKTDRVMATGTTAMDIIGLA